MCSIGVSNRPNVPLYPRLSFALYHHLEAFRRRRRRRRLWQVVWLEKIIHLFHCTRRLVLFVDPNICTPPEVLLPAVPSGRSRKISHKICLFIHRIITTSHLMVVLPMLFPLLSRVISTSILTILRPISPPSLSLLTQPVFVGIIAVGLNNYSLTRGQSFKISLFTPKSILDMQTLLHNALITTFARWVAFDQAIIFVVVFRGEIRGFHAFGHVCTSCNLTVA